MRIADALRLLRTRHGLTQTAAAQRPGAPDFRTLSHWETRRKLPSMRLLYSYLESLGHNFHDLQDAMDQIEGRPLRRLELADTFLQEGIEELARNPDFCRRVANSLNPDFGRRVDRMEQRLDRVEGRAAQKNADSRVD